MNIRSLAVAVLLIGAFVGFNSAHAAAPKHHVGLNCGLPHPDAGCGGSAAVTPAPAAPSTGTIAPSDTNSILTAVLDLQADLVGDLTNTLNRQASPINAATGEAWDGPLVMCLGGTPAMGTPGAAGFVKAQPGLIAWINGLQGPAATVSSVPPLGPDAGPAEVLEHTHLVAVAGLQDLNTAVSPIVAQITKGGSFPEAITTPCGSFVQEIQGQIITANNQIATYGALLLAVIPKPLMMKHLEKIHAAKG